MVAAIILLMIIGGAVAAVVFMDNDFARKTRERIKASFKTLIGKSDDSGDNEKTVPNTLIDDEKIVNGYVFCDGTYADDQRELVTGPQWDNVYETIEGAITACNSGMIPCDGFEVGKQLVEFYGEEEGQQDATASPEAYKYYRFTPGTAEGSWGWPAGQDPGNWTRVGEIELWDDTEKIWGHGVEGVSVTYGPTHQDTSTGITTSAYGEDQNEVVFDGKMDQDRERAYWANGNSVYFLLNLPSARLATRFRFGNNITRNYVTRWTLEGTNDEGDYADKVWTMLLDNSDGSFGNAGVGGAWATDGSTVNSTASESFWPISNVMPTVATSGVVQPVDGPALAAVPESGLTYKSFFKTESGFTEKDGAIVTTGAPFLMSDMTIEDAKTFCAGNADCKMFTVSLDQRKIVPFTWKENRSDDKCRPDTRFVSYTRK